MYNYLKALHIIFVVTWFAGMFYLPRLFIYNTEAGSLPEAEKNILRKQFSTMMRRLWYGITWPSAILTLVLGLWVMLNGNWISLLGDPGGRWLLLKLGFVILLYVYHLSLHIIFRQEMKGIFTYSSQQLRIWNEVATVLLFAIVMLAAVKQSISLAYGIGGLALLILGLMAGIWLYKSIREKKNK